MTEAKEIAGEIPILDLAPYFAGQPGALESTARRLRHINENVGFLYIVGHGVDQLLIDKTFAETANFHARPLEEKLAVKVDADMQGYLPIRGSTTRSSTLSQGSKPNENEAFFVKREGDPGVNNRWPGALPAFKQAATAYYAALEALARRMLPLYAAALELPPDYFDAKCDKPFSSLRLTHYPAAQYTENQYGIAPHTDSSFITLLAQNSVPGLQIRKRDGTWIDAPVVPNSFIVNTGDMLHRWSNGRFLSTPHRAFNLSPQPRYAIPYFFHPNPDTLIDCLPTCQEGGAKFEPMTTAGYMAWFRGRNYAHLRKEEPAAAA